MFHFRVRNGAGWGHRAVTTRLRRGWGGGGWVPLVSLFRLSGVRAAVLCVGGAWGLFWGGQVGIRVAGGGKWGGFRFVSESCF